MSKKSLTSTQIKVNFSISTDNDRALLFVLLFIWLCRSVAYRVGYEAKVVTQDLREALGFTTKVFLIGFNSIVWGMGL